MPSLSSNDIARITDYVAGELTSEDPVQTERWIAQDGERMQLAESLRRSRDILREEWATGIDVEGNVRALLAEVARREDRKGHDNVLSRGQVEAGKKRQIGGNRGTEIAGQGKGGFLEQTLRRAGTRVSGFAIAGLAVVAVFGGILVWHARGAHAHASVAVTTYATTNAQRANITLPDGNTVSLNVASRLDVPVDYPSGNHTVRLTGEALFTVTHHDATPFVVEAGAVATRVLGTSFAVRHYRTDTTTTIAVRDGKVTVQSAVLTPNREMEVDRTGIVSVRPTSAGRFSFATGTLRLPGMSLREAIPDLNRWYDADIRLGDPALAIQRIQGKVTTGSLSELADMLALTFDVRVVRDGRVLTLYPK